MYLPVLRIARERADFLPIASAIRKGRIPGSRGKVDLYDAVAHGNAVAIRIPLRHAGRTPARVADRVAGFRDFQDVAHGSAFVEIFRSLSGSVGREVGDGVGADSEAADDLDGRTRKRRAARVVYVDGNAGSRAPFDAFRFRRVGGVSGFATPGAATAVLGVPPNGIGIPAGDEFGVRTDGDAFSGGKVTGTGFRFRIGRRRSGCGSVLA